jgi:RNA polymerase sigma factor (sigma-70 family)
MTLAGRNVGAVLRRIERLFTVGSVAGLSEGQLLERFATAGDEAAFEALLTRYGPMVLGICRGVLRNPADVEDAFQATFLVLVQKAGTLRNRDLLGNWLFGVASRVARRARAVGARRRAFEESNPRVDPPAPGDGHDADRDSQLSIIHEEVCRLPRKYRVAVLLCYLEGLTHQEAARQLGWPLGTVKGRLARARGLLQRRLTRRGVALSVSAIATGLASTVRAAVPGALIESTLKAALALAAGRTLAAAGIAANVVTLVEGVSNIMFLNTFKAVVTVLVAGAVTTGAGVLAFQGDAGPGTPPAGAPGPPTSVATAPVEIPNAFKNAVSPLLDAAGRMYQSQWDAYAKGRVGGDRIAEASRRWLETQLSESAGADDRIAAYAAHLKRMTILEAYEYSQLPKHQGADESFAAARFLRLQAEQMLADEKGRSSKAPVTAESSLPAPLPTPVGPPVQAPNVVLTKDAMGRIEIAKLAPRITARDRSPKTAAVVKTMEKPLSMSFASETPLEDVLKYIQSGTAGPDQARIAIYVDPFGLNEVQKTMTSPVTLDLEGVPLKTSLRLLLKQLNLAYCVKDGVLIISSIDRILQELREAEAIEEAETTSGRTTANEVPETTPTPGPGPAIAAPATPETKKWQAIEAALEAPLKLTIAKETRLVDVFKALKQAVLPAAGAAIPIYIDPSIEGKLTIPDEFDAQGIPLRAALSLLLSQFGLDWDLQDGLLIISTSNGLQEYRRIASHFSSQLGLSLDAFSAPSSLSPEVQAKFDAPISLSFPEPIPLDEVMKVIRNATRSNGSAGIPVFYGPAVWDSARGSSRKIGNLLVRIEVKEIPLRTCMALVLGFQPRSLLTGEENPKPLPLLHLDGRIIDGVLVIGEGTWVQSIPSRQGGFQGGMGSGMGRMGGQGMM